MFLLFLHAFLEAVFIPVPPDPTVALYAPRVGVFLAAALAAVGSTAGGLVSYALGKTGQRLKRFQEVERLYRRYGDLALMAAALTPLPYSVFAAASGFLGYSWRRFLLLSLIFRGLRFLMVALLAAAVL